MYQALIIDIKVTNLARATTFYEHVLGVPLIHKDDTWASFGIGGAEVHLYVHAGATEGIEFRVSDIRGTVETLTAKGVVFYSKEGEPGLIAVDDEVMEFSWGKIAYFKDSEDNQLALVQDQ